MGYLSQQAHKPCSISHVVDRVDIAVDYLACREQPFFGYMVTD